MRSAAHVPDSACRDGGWGPRGTRTQLASAEMDTVVGRPAVSVACHSFAITPSTRQRGSVLLAADCDIVMQVTRITRRVGSGWAACAPRMQLSTAICARDGRQVAVAARCTRRGLERVQCRSVLSTCHGNGMPLAARCTRRGTSCLQRGLVLSA